MRRVKRASGGRLRAASLVEAVVAAVVLLIAFTAAMELLPRLTLRGSTLAETLVMMLVAGIVFLAAMEALTLVSRLVARRAAVLVEAGRQHDGIFRLGPLLVTADSVRGAEGGGTGELLYLYRAGGETTLTTRDSAAVFVAGEFRDTLLRLSLIHI